VLELKEEISDLEYTSSVKGTFVLHPDGYYVGIPHKIFKIEDYTIEGNNSLEKV
jgi:hypothetical protein